MHLHQAERGFTLVEMLVSLALFTIVATMAVGTLLILISGNGRVVSEQTVLTSLSFALDSMTRELRTGSEYYCGSESFVTGAVVSSMTDTRDCSAGAAGISFREAGQSISGSSNSTRRIAYYFAQNKLWRKVGSNPAEEIVTNDVRITSGRFVVTGSTPLDLSNDATQPSVSIMIQAMASSTDATDRVFTLQTTVTQRALDI